jgi:hypothetical protein
VISPGTFLKKSGDMLRPPSVSNDQTYQSNPTYTKGIANTFTCVHTYDREEPALFENELVEFEKQRFEAQDFKNITDHFIIIYRIYPH